MLTKASTYKLMNLMQFDALRCRPATRRLALHCLVLGNAHAIACLWPAVVDELRFRHWEAAAPLPRMDAPKAAAHRPHGTAGGNIGARAGPFASAKEANPDTPTSSSPITAGFAPPAGPARPDLSACLLHQKLQMLDFCIFQNQSQDRNAGADSTRCRLLAAEGAALPHAGDAAQVRPQGAQQLAGPSGRVSRGSSPALDRANSDSGSGYGSCEEGNDSWEALGVAGTLPGCTLARHPDRLLRVPITQVCLCLPDSFVEITLGKPSAGT